MTIVRALLELRKIRILQNGRLLCPEMNVSLFPKEHLAILGKEGSGKSLLLRVMAGLQRPTSGEVIWQGHLLTGVPPVGQIGVLFRDPEVRFLSATPWEECALTPVSLGLKTKELQERVEASLAMAGLDGKHANRDWSELSASMRYRAGVAALFAMRPKLILADEPGGPLSDEGEQELADRFLEFGQTYGTSFIIFTSRPARATIYADRMIPLTHCYS